MIRLFLTTVLSVVVLLTTAKTATANDELVTPLGGLILFLNEEVNVIKPKQPENLAFTKVNTGTHKLSWTEQPIEGIQYTVELDVTTALKADETTWEVLETTTWHSVIVATALYRFYDNGLLRFRLTACLGASCSEPIIFATQIDSSEMVVGIPEMYAAVVTGNRVDFSWSPVSGASYYELELHYDVTKPPQIIESILQPNHTLILNSGQYAAKVRACLHNGVCSALSEFTYPDVGGVAIEAPQINPSVITGNQVYISWGSVPEADYYELELHYDVTKPPRIIAPVNASNHTLTLESGNYAARVKACTNNSICSAVSGFTFIDLEGFLLRWIPAEVRVGETAILEWKGPGAAACKATESSENSPSSGRLPVAVYTSGNKIVEWHCLTSEGEIIPESVEAMKATLKVNKLAAPNIREK